MATAYRISLPQPRLSGTITLEPSKSISNRALIMQSMCDQPFAIHRLSQSDDTRALQAMLASGEKYLNSGHAGSSYRFMVARLCLGEREVTLDGSDQMRRRPIGPLVRALQKLGADITYAGKEGFPPLLIKPATDLGQKTNEITLQAGVSSQYISALLMIAPRLPNGLILHLEDDPVSESYIRMTLTMMEYFGVSHSWTGNTILVENGSYLAKPITIEGDWSSASYFYSMAALVEQATIEIEGLNELSLQGDQVTKQIYESFGVNSHFHENGLTITKAGLIGKPGSFQFNFSSCPDVAQTVMVTLAGLGIRGKLEGLKTLRIKETDRIAAMQVELEKVKSELKVYRQDGDYYCTISGKAKWKDKAKFDTYQDHRMAMALTPLACIHPVLIREPDVVSKSYPNFWKDIEKIGLRTLPVKAK